MIFLIQIQQKKAYFEDLKAFAAFKAFYAFESF